MKNQTLLANANILDSSGSVVDKVICNLDDYMSNVQHIQLCGMSILDQMLSELEALTQVPNHSLASKNINL